MGKPLLLRGEKLSGDMFLAKNGKHDFKKNGTHLFAVMIMILGLTLQIWNTQPVFYAHAYVSDGNVPKIIQPAFLDSQPQIFEKNKAGSSRKVAADQKSQKQNQRLEKQA